jgi:hypothetical protein
VLGVDRAVHDVDGEARVSLERNVGRVGAVVAVVVVGRGQRVEGEDALDVCELRLDDLDEHWEDVVVLDDSVGEW